jgi:hypothetical protein
MPTGSQRSGESPGWRLPGLEFNSPKGRIFGPGLKKISSLCLIRSRVTITTRHPPAWAVAEWAVWIRPVSDRRLRFGDFLNRDLWFCDFLIEMLGGESSFPGRVFSIIGNIGKLKCALAWNEKSYWQHELDHSSAKLYTALYTTR